MKKIIEKRNIMIYQKNYKSKNSYNTNIKIIIMKFLKNMKQVKKKLKS